MKSLEVEANIEIKMPNSQTPICTISFYEIYYPIPSRWVFFSEVKRKKSRKKNKIKKFKRAVHASVKLI